MNTIKHLLTQIITASLLASVLVACGAEEPRTLAVLSILADSPSVDPGELTGDEPACEPELLYKLTDVRGVGEEHGVIAGIRHGEIVCVDTAEGLLDSASSISDRSSLSSVLQALLAEADRVDREGNTLPDVPESGETAEPSPQFSDAPAGGGEAEEPSPQFSDAPSGGGEAEEPSPQFSDAPVGGGEAEEPSPQFSDAPVGGGEAEEPSPQFSDASGGEAEEPSPQFSDQPVPDQPVGEAEPAHAIDIDEDDCPPEVEETPEV